MAPVWLFDEIAPTCDDLCPEIDATPLNPQCSIPPDLKTTSKEPEAIAVVGYSIRFPQDANTSDTFWQMLVDGRSARTEIPRERFNIDAFYHPDIERLDSLSVKTGHFLKDDLAAFDAPFFSMTSAEAASMDPQQRILLETTYRALENAGMSMAETAGSKTSVHIGSFTRDWNNLLNRDPLSHMTYEATGAQASMLANRLSWFYDFTGPSISLDTACSSSMMALHLACQSLRSREATMGVVGGASLLLDPESMAAMANMNMLSPDGKCYSFDHRANGYARGEGVGVVVIKLLSSALQDGDTVRAIIRVTASNQDGKTPGITQPSEEAQEDLIREAYQAAGLDLSITRYFEAHGTGTPTGDPKEAKAIATAFSGLRARDDPLYIGSVKTNIGHLEGTSGIASLIKTLLILEKGVITPNIWFERANPKILEEDWNIKFPTEPCIWPTRGLRRASVNSFGFGGSNVHVVLDDVFHYFRLHGFNGNHCTAESPSLHISNGYNSHSSRPSNGMTASDPSNSSPRLFVWSAGDEDGTTRLASSYDTHLATLIARGETTDYFESLAYTLSMKRSSLRWKSYAVASSLCELQQVLEKGLAKALRSTKGRKLSYIFTGQGAQWHAMGRELWMFPAFKESLFRSQAALDYLGCEWSLPQELHKAQSDSNINLPSYSQPICTALQIALVELLRVWGVRPESVIGHSSGEIAAAFCAGALSHESAMKVAYYRGYHSAKLLESSSFKGSMMSVSLSESETRTQLRKISTQDVEDVVVACVNSPRNVTLSGKEEQIENVKHKLDAQGVLVRKLKVDIAYHSQAMDKIAQDYSTSISDLVIGDLDLGQPVIYSTVTGKRIAAKQMSQSEYWIRNLISQVKFSEALCNLCTTRTGCSTAQLGIHGDDKATTDLLEIGPHSALQGPVYEVLAASSLTEHISYSSMLKRGVSATVSSLSAIGRLYSSGYDIDLPAVNTTNTSQPNVGMILADLPEYPFDHSQTYWAESRLSRNLRFRGPPRHELLGVPVPDWNPKEARWRHIIRSHEVPWITQHKVNNLEVYPAAGLMIMAIEAAHQMADIRRTISGYSLKNVTFKQALFSMSLAQDFETQVHLRPLQSSDNKATGSSEFRVYTYENEGWAENCQGEIAVEYLSSDINKVDRGREAQHERDRLIEAYRISKRDCTMAIDAKRLYQRFDSMGLGYGPTYQALESVRFTVGQAVGIVKLREWTADVDENKYQKHVIHPTAFDGILQLTFPTLLADDKRSFKTMVPEQIRSAWISHEGLSGSGNDRLKAFAYAAHESERAVTGSIVCLDPNSEEPRILINGLRVAAVNDQATKSSATATKRQTCFRYDWRPDVDLLCAEELVRFCENAAPRPSPHKDMIAMIEFMCYSALTNTLQSLNHRNITNMKAHFRKYIDWMKRQSERYELGELIHWMPEWRCLCTNQDYNEKVIREVRSSSGEGKFYAEVALKLLPMLEGKVDALDLLFSGDLVAEYYKESSGTTLAYRALEPAIDAIAHKNPSLKILEIGAGTGATTELALSTLTRQGHGSSRFSQYVFTDISPGFFEKARKSFHEHAGRMRFATLDIEKDPLPQGFRAGEYDIIIAANVLHATPELSVTLQNTRRLLKPGGKLVLLDLYNPAVTRVEFAFGLLPGWWLSTEHNRQWGPLLSRDGWHDVLRSNGFSGADVSFDDLEDQRTQMGIAVLSTAVKTSEDLIPTREKVVIVAEPSEMQQSLACTLKRELEATNTSRCETISTFEISSATMGQSFCIFLHDLEAPYLQSMTEDDYTRLQCLVKSCTGLLWARHGGGQYPSNAAVDIVLGLARSVLSEDGSKKFITLNLQDAEDVRNNVHQIITLVRDTFRTSSEQSESEYEERDGRLCINRLVENQPLNDILSLKTVAQGSKIQEFGKPDYGLKLNVGTLGLLDTMEYIEDRDTALPFADNDVEVKVKAVGINFKDVLISLGRLTEGGLGNECAGVVTRVGPESSFNPGDRVLVCALNTYKTYVRSTDMTVFKIPDATSFREAAALPVVYTTAYRALFDSARLKAEESILIHSGAGGTGQAAIQLAKLLKADIFVTVGSEEKRQLIMDLYAIPEERIFSSRGMSFTQGIKRVTKGRGVDVVLNSLAGASLEGSWECLAPFGRFVEIGKRDILNGGKLPMLPFNENRTFTAINLTHMISERPALIRETMLAIMDLVKEGKIGAPQPLHFYRNSQIEQAFRYLQGGKNTGKTILEMNDDDLVPFVPNSRPKYDFKGDKTYLISGGLGGLGRAIARWMATRGASNLILLGRSGACSENAIALVDELTAMGVTVKTPACDISDGQSLAAVVADCSKSMPPIKGCIQGSMVLRDSLFEKMSYKDFVAAIKPKVDGSWNLHKVLGNDLDFFILLSSTSGIVGARGQSNYSAGNTYQDALARYRMARGQKATSLDLGVILSSGYVAERPKVLQSMTSLGFLPLEEAELLALLEHYCDPALDNSSSEDCHVITGLEVPASMRAQHIDEAYWMAKPQFRGLHQIENVSATVNTERETNADVAALVSSAGSAAEAGNLVIDALTKKLSKVLNVAQEDVDPSTPMHSAGVDSLIAVEIRNWFSKTLGIDVTVFEILGNARISDICLGVAGKYWTLLEASVQQQDQVRDP